MYIETVPNRASPPAILLREGWREGGKVKKRTIANLSKWPPELVEGLRTLLKGGVAVGRAEDAFTIHRSWPHGHVAAVLGTARRLRLDRLIGRDASRERQVVLAMIVARLIAPTSKLATARGLCPETASSSLGRLLALGVVDEDELYRALDWLEARQGRIERSLARRHLEDGALVLYDVTSSYLEGRHCELAGYGYSRDRKRGKLQIVFGLMCNGAGCPVAVEAFEGNLGDPRTLGAQIAKLKDRFGLTRVVLVGDRGLLTEARLREEVAPAGLDWITALRAPAIRRLAAQAMVQPSLFDERDLAEISSPDYPGERLLVCRNPLLAAERGRKREELLAATAAALDKIVAATRRARAPLRDRDKINQRLGAVIHRHKMAKHFRCWIEDDGGFAYECDAAAIAAEAALDGIYVLRTSLPARALAGAGVVRAYKGLAGAERAFRSLKSVDLRVRPIHHRLARRVRGHLLLCMLAYYVEWHMRQALAPMLFDDHDKAAAEAARPSVVAPARRSPAAKRKAAAKRAEDGLPVHSFQSLIADLATLCCNRVATPRNPDYHFDIYTEPTPTQTKAFQLLGLRPKM